MAYGAMTAAAPAMGAMETMQPGGELHPIMGLIAARWPNFGNGKTPQQKKAMISVWESDLADIPLSLQKAALDAKVRAGHTFPPSSSAELRKWCNEIRPPMTKWDAKMYADWAEDGFCDPDFCRRQIEKYEKAEAAGRSAYAGWD